MNSIVGTKLQSWSSKSGLLKLALAMLLLLGSFLPVQAWAYDGEVAGQIYVIEGRGDGAAVGIVLAGSPSLCPNAPGSVWAYVAVGVDGATIDGVKSMEAKFLAAKLAGLPVRVYTYNNPGGWGCILHAIQVGW
jgi:hypothetical protein